MKPAALLTEIASIAGVQRVRFTSPHPREFDDDCISVIAEMETICNQVHLPVQSGSNPILKRMRRQYTRERYLELVGKFRNCGRSIALSTDIIVGFIGESEADFQQTLSLVEEVQFESMFSFKYSPRPETEAQIMALQHIQKGIQLRLHQQRYLGRCMSVLVEGTARDGVRRYGRTTTNKIVNFPGDDQPGTPMS
jgi:tRNA-2-methylthio-N6-dimethylallyladenosine synthase